MRPHFWFVPTFWFFLATLVLCDAKKIPRFFVFGDSLVDTGNNNYIATVAKANVQPYGIDFSPSGGRPTGRFCNGKTFLDLTIDEFGASCYPPASLGTNSIDDIISCGINYASAGAGILNETGAVFLDRICMDKQIAYFSDTRDNLISSIGSDKTSELLQNAVFPIIIGSNDFLDNYFTPLVGSQKYIPPEAYLEILITEHRRQLTELYDSDARNFIIWNVPPIGCMPLERILHPEYGGNCMKRMNELAVLYNQRLKDLVTELSSNFAQVTIVYIDMYNILDDILHNSIDYGIEVINVGCCKNEGPVVEILPCKKTATCCNDRSKYLFWDPYHPSEYTNTLMVKRFMDGGEEDNYPFNLRKAIEILGF